MIDAGKALTSIDFFLTPFFVPLPKDAPDGITLRVVAADPSSGNFGLAEAKFPVLSERLPPKLPRQLHWLLAISLLS